LKGKANNAPLVYVGSNSTFVMQSGTITGNNGGSLGGGVYVGGGTFTMYGGTISGNTCGSYGAGVFVQTGTFTMRGGTISGDTVTGSNSAYGGGGVYVVTNGTFRLVTGTIYGSNALPASLANTVTGTSTGAALRNEGTAQRGRFSGTGGAWVSSGNLATTNNTINVLNGANQ
jgi:hypothetical protein